MFKLHKPQLSGSIHSGHFMVSRLDDDEEDNNDPADDSSESERENANSVEIDVNNPESVVDAATNLDINYRVDSPSAKDEQLTSWNDLDKPAGKHSQKQHPQYLTYYTNSYSSEESRNSGSGISGGAPASSQVDSLSSLHHTGIIADRMQASHHGSSVGGACSTSKDFLARGLNSHLNHLHQHHHLQQDNQLAILPSLQQPQQQQQNNHKNSQHHHHHHHGYNSSHQLHNSHHQHHNQQLHHYQQQQVQQHPHAVTIDTSLTKLLECMSLYYSGKLTSPKWKSFKGLKLRLKYKIRLNNLIWRAWFLQCIRGRRPPGCQFTAPVETDVHKKSETIVLEGKYWKRKEKAIVDEYKKWRIFHKQKSQMNCFRPSSFDWDSRVSNLASSSSCGPEHHFYPDYDMNIPYNLDDLPPMLEDIDTREVEAFYQPQAPAMRMIEQSQPTEAQQQTLQLQQQQQQQHHQQHHNTSSSNHHNCNSNSSSHHHHHHSNQQQQHQHHHHQQQLAQLQVNAATAANAATLSRNNSQQAISLKLAQPVIVTSNRQAQVHGNFPHQTIATSLSAQQQQQQVPQSQLHQQQHQLQRPTSLPFSFEINPLYQQINEQLQQQLPISPQQNQQHLQQHHHQPQQLSLHHQSHQTSSHHHNQQQLQQQQQQQQQHNVVMSLGQDLYGVGGGGSGGSGSSSGGGSVRNEQRRVCHINAEQKRRCNIKNGFDTLKSILPSINQSVNVKISKASMLQKAALHISHLSDEQKKKTDEQEMLQQQIEALKQTISSYQCQLPASGGPVGCSGSSHAREMLQDYVRKRTLDNWKFWIFSLVIEPLFETYYNSVSTATLEDSCKTIFTWLDRNCGLMSLRKEVLESLTFLSTNTNILNTPQTLPTEAVDAVRYPTTSGPRNINNNNSPQPSSLVVSGPPRQQQQQLSQHPFQQSSLQSVATPMQATQTIRNLW